MTPASPAEDRVRESFGRRWEFAAEGNELVARERDGDGCLSAYSWEVLGCLLLGYTRRGLAAEVTARHYR
jgi:hypothetical protein